MRITAMIIGIIAFLITAYFIGHNQGEKYSAKYLEQPPEYWEELVRLDRTFLAKTSMLPNTIQTGNYLFEIGFPGKTMQSWPVTLNFTNGQLSAAPNPDTGTLITQALVQEANALSWEQVNTDEKPPAYYVGLIEGTVIWGKVYVRSSRGWHQSPPTVGVWKLSPVTTEKY